MVQHHPTGAPTHPPETHTPHPPKSKPDGPEPTSKPGSEPPPSRGPASAGGGNGYHLHTESLGTMEGHLGRTRDKVEGVGQQLAATNFGTQTMGVLGTGMTGTLNNTLGTAHEPVTRASTAVEHAGAQTTAVRQRYEQTDANAVEALKNTSKG